jgi:hypothetical protein
MHNNIEINQRQQSKVALALGRGSAIGRLLRLATCKLKRHCALHQFLAMAAIIIPEKNRNTCSP